MILEALFIFAGGAVVTEIVGLLVGTDAAVKAAGKRVESYGQEVEARTRAVCSTQTAIEIEAVSKETLSKANKAWGAATVTLQESHAQALEQTQRETALAARDHTIRALAASGHLRDPE